AGRGWVRVVVAEVKRHAGHNSRHGQLSGDQDELGARKLCPKQYPAFLQVIGLEHAILLDLAIELSARDGRIYCLTQTDPPIPALQFRNRRCSTNSSTFRS